MYNCNLNMTKQMIVWKILCRRHVFFQSWVTGLLKITKISFGRIIFSSWILLTPLAHFRCFLYSINFSEYLVWSDYRKNNRLTICDSWILARRTPRGVTCLIIPLVCPCYIPEEYQILLCLSSERITQKLTLTWYVPFLIVIQHCIMSRSNSRLK